MSLPFSARGLQQLLLSKRDFYVITSVALLDWPLFRKMNTPCELFLIFSCCCCSIPYTKIDCFLGCLNKLIIEDLGCDPAVGDSEYYNYFTKKYNISHVCGSMPITYPPSGIINIYQPWCMEIMHLVSSVSLSMCLSICVRFHSWIVWLMDRQTDRQMDITKSIVSLLH